ncbi:acetyl-CoA carboxylase biotin carboxylase subunit family protein [Streptomyces hokutonensis]|uniref:ATP-grasp domain-containing protein n=1 Tax=Streptomyces hokutonensis TaxID=1306990 RepID=UPI003812FFA0
MSAEKKPTLIVVHDAGAPPSEVAVPLATWVNCVFVVLANEHTRKITPILAAFGEVLEVDNVEHTAEVLRRYEPDGIITYCEEMQRLTAHLAELLELRYHSRPVAELLTDKWQQRAVLRAAGVDSVRTALIHSEPDWEPAAEYVGFPAVLKPVHGVASGNTFLVADEAAGLARLREVLALDKPGLVEGGGLVLEEFLQGRPCAPFGDYVSVETAVVDGEPIDLGVTGKLPMAPPFRETGRFWPSPFGEAENEEFRALARSAVRALGVRHGITHTELKLTSRGPRLIEVNGRLGGGIQDLALSAMGLDLVEYGARIALGDPPPPRLVAVDGVHYQILPPAPQASCEVVSIEGAKAVRALDGVKNCRIYVKPGEVLEGGTATKELGRINGVCADHTALARFAEEAGSLLRMRFVFEGEAESRCLTGNELASL